MIHGDQKLPQCLNIGTSGGPGFSTRVRGEDTGYQRRTPVWTKSVGTPGQGAQIYEGPSKVQYRGRKLNLSAEDYAEILSMFWTCYGRGYGFRFKDPADWSTHPDGDKLPNIFDFSHYTELRKQQGTERRWLLAKQYVESTFEEGIFARVITRPMRPSIDSEAVLALFPQGGPVSSTTGSPIWVHGIDFTTDFDTGEMRIHDDQALPAPGSQVYACFTFHVPAYFGGDRLVGILAETQERTSINELLIIESPIDNDHGDGSRRFGGWHNVDYNAQDEYLNVGTYWIDVGDGAFQQFDGMPASRAIILPEVTLPPYAWPSAQTPYQNPFGVRPPQFINPKGGPYLKIWNNGPNPIAIAQAANGPNYGNGSQVAGYHLAIVDDLPGGLKPGGVAEFRVAQLWDDSGASVEQRQSLWEAV